MLSGRTGLRGESLGSTSLRALSGHPSPAYNWLAFATGLVDRPARASIAVHRVCESETSLSKIGHPLTSYPSRRSLK